jgi:hypothetical protein
LQALIEGVKADAAGEGALLELSQASKTVSDLEQVGDALLGHFVDQAAGADIRGRKSARRSVSVSKRPTSGSPTCQD